MIYYNNKIINKTSGNKVYYGDKLIGQNIINVEKVNNTLAFEFNPTAFSFNYTINEQSFSANYSPFSVDIKKELGIEKFTSARNMFSTSEITNLTSMPDVKNVTTFDNMFYSCKSFQSLDASKWNVAALTTAKEMFKESGVDNVNLSNWNAPLLTNVSSMFAQSYITTVNLSNWNTPSLTNMSNMFSLANKIEIIDLSSINVENVTDMSGIFSSCRELTTLDLSGWKLNENVNTTSMFFEDYNLTTIIMKNCSQSSIDKIKAALSAEGIEGQVTIITE